MSTSLVNCLLFFIGQDKWDRGWQAGEADTIIRATEASLRADRK